MSGTHPDQRLLPPWGLPPRRGRPRPLRLHPPHPRIDAIADTATQQAHAAGERFPPNRSHVSSAGSRGRRVRVVKEDGYNRCVPGHHTRQRACIGSVDRVTATRHSDRTACCRRGDAAAGEESTDEGDRAGTGGGSGYGGDRGPGNSSDFQSAYPNWDRLLQRPPRSQGMAQSCSDTCNTSLVGAITSPGSMRSRG